MLDWRNVWQLATAASCDCGSPKRLPNHQAPGGPPRTQAPSISQHLPAAMSQGGSCGTRIPVHPIPGQHSRLWPPVISHKPKLPAHSAAECFHGTRLLAGSPKPRLCESHESQFWLAPADQAISCGLRLSVSLQELKLQVGDYEPRLLARVTTAGNQKRAAIAILIPEGKKVFKSETVTRDK